MDPSRPYRYPWQSLFCGLVCIVFHTATLCGKGPDAVSIRLTASSGITGVYINGTSRPLGANAANWKKADDYGAAADLRVLAVACVNAVPEHTEAGFIGVVTLVDGRRICTDGLWKTFHPTDGASPPVDAAGHQWYEEDYDDRAWEAAVSDGTYGIPPWGTDLHPPFKKGVSDWPAGEAPQLDSAMREMVKGAVQWNAEWIWYGNATYAVSPVYFRRTFVPTAANAAQVPTTPGKYNLDTVTVTGAELSWTPSFGPGGVAGYHIYWNGLCIATTADTRCTVGDLAINATAQNYLYVRAFDSRGQESAPTAFLVARLVGRRKPKPPANLRVTARYKDGFDMAWDPPDDGVGADSYEVDVKCAGGGAVFFCPGSVTRSTCRLSTIRPATPCTMTIRSMDADLNRSNASEPTLRSTLPAAVSEIVPEVPANPRISARTEGSITLAWDTPKNGGPMPGYRVYKNGLPVGTTRETTFTCGRWQRGYFSVQAYDADANESGLSAAVPVDGSAGDPEAPVLVDAGRTDSSVVLRWDRADATVCSSFTLQCWNADDAAGTSTDTQIDDPYATTQEISGLTPGTAYRFVLVANGANGVKISSKPLTLRTVVPPTATPLMMIASAYLPSGNPPQLRRVVADAATQGCTFLAIGGNHVEQDAGTDEQWKKYMDAINGHRGEMSVYLTPQSHDTQSCVYDPKVGAEIFFNAKYNRFTRMTGFGLNYAVSCGPVRLISASSMGATPTEPLLARTQLFLQEQLRAAEIDPAIRWVFVAGGEGQGGAFEKTNWRYPMLQTGRPVIYLSQSINGNPDYQLTWQPGMNYLTTSAQSARAGGGNYQIIHVYENRLVFQQRTFDTGSGAWTTGRWYEVLYDRAANRLDPGQVRQTIVGGAVVGKPAPSLSTEAPWAQNLSVRHSGKPVAVRLLGRSPRERPLTYTVVTPPAHGRLVGIPPELIYEPEPGYAGQDVFVYRVSDGSPTTSNHAFCRIEASRD